MTNTHTPFTIDMDADDLDAQRPATITENTWAAVTSAIATARCLGSRVCSTRDRDGQEWRAVRADKPGAALYDVQQVTA